MHSVSFNSCVSLVSFMTDCVNLPDMVGGRGAKAPDAHAQLNRADIAKLMGVA